MTAAEKMSVGDQVHVLSIGRIRESGTNPRRDFGDMKELAASIETHGLLQPVMVRPARVPGGESIPNEYELVFGHRRYRAAKMAGQLQIRAVVRDLSDEEVLEIQLVENAKRKDIHPLEEFAALHRLHTQYGYSIEKLAERIQKSPRSVYARLQLKNLCEDARRLLELDQIDFSLALLLARIPDPKLQAEATAKVTNGDEPMAYRAAQELIRREYMLALKEAPFRLEDAKLVPSCGACSTCHKRTQAQPDLFHEIKGPDLCIDPGCYRGKLDAHWKRLQEEAKKKGRTVIPDEEATNLFTQHEPDVLGLGAPYVEVTEKCWDHPEQKTYAELLGPNAGALVRDLKGGLHVVVKREDLPRLLKDAGHEVKREKPKKTDWNEDDAKKKEQVQKLRALAAVATKYVVEASEDTDPDERFWRIILSMRWGQDSAAEVARRRGYTGERALAELWIRAQAKTMKEDQLRALVLELAITPAVTSDSKLLGQPLRDAMQLYHVDMKAVKREAEPKKPKANAVKKKGVR